ncbi:hypothetical protein F5B20DRAFT_580837 [Whalleya microplaca]|nr:hypothetical protein F5B20DRAFT_580837 [Whalleya microplaca]
MSPSENSTAYCQAPGGNTSQPASQQSAMMQEYLRSNESGTVWYTHATSSTKAEDWEKHYEGRAKNAIQEYDNVAKAEEKK